MESLVNQMIKSKSHGSTNTNINAKNIKDIDVLLPPLSLQIEFVEFVEKIRQLPNPVELFSNQYFSIAQEMFA